MRQQVEAYSQSLARALVGAGHLPPPWLLPPDAGDGALELRDGAEEQMRQQVVSYSQSLAGALLAAGHCPPAWLLQAPADVATDGRYLDFSPASCIMVCWGSCASISSRDRDLAEHLFPF